MSADHDHSHDSAVPAHDQAAEVAHAWEHFWENARFFAGFLTVILLTVAAFNVNFGPTGNVVAIIVLAALRSGLIAYFMASLFKNFSFIFRTFVFTVLFFIGMVFLSVWDSPLPHVGNPIVIRSHVP